jgi:hypothetical protein
MLIISALSMCSLSKRDAVGNEMEREIGNDI